MDAIQRESSASSLHVLNCFSCDGCFKRQGTASVVNYSIASIDHWLVWCRVLPTYWLASVALMTYLWFLFFFKFILNVTSYASYPTEGCTVCVCREQAAARSLYNHKRDDTECGRRDRANSQTHCQISAAVECGTAGVVLWRWGLSHVSTV